MTSSVVLRPIQLDDTPSIVRWRNSSDVARWLYSQEVLTDAMHLSWMANQVATGKCSQFIIDETRDGKYRGIGTVFIKNIDRANSKGEFGIFIGEPDARGKGYASQATRLILQHAFMELGLNRVYLTVQHDNIAGIKAYEKAGFVREGLLRQDYKRYDGYCDIVCMGITRDMWITREGTEEV